MYVLVILRPASPDNHQQNPHHGSLEAMAGPGGEIEIFCRRKLANSLDRGFALLLLALLFIPMLVNRYLA